MSVPTSAGRTPLRVGLLGCGAVARLYYAPALRALESEGEIRVRALLDPDPAARAEAGRAFPGATGARALGDLPTGEIDLAIVASPPRFHAEQAVRLLEAGVAVLCEKPLAESYADAAAMVRAAESAERMLAVAMVRRFLPAAGIIRRLLAAGALGPNLRFSCREGGPFRWPTRSPTFFRGRGGGVLLDVGVHLLDLLTWWLGPPDGLDYEDDAMGGVAANCRIRLRFAGGAGGEVRLSRDTEQPNLHHFAGDLGWLSWNTREPADLRLGFRDVDHALDARVREVLGGGEAPLGGTDAGGYVEAFGAQLRNAVAAARGAGRPAVTGRDALDTMRLLDECEASRSLLPMPWLGDRELAAARRWSGAGT